MTVQEQIRANADMVVEQLREVSGMSNFGYNAESVAWVDGFIDRQRVRPDFDEGAIHQMRQNLGSYLGECVRTCYGGEWQEQEGTWAIAFNSKNAVFPFTKVSKHLVNGYEDSVQSWFDVIPVLFSQYIRPQAPKKKPWWKRG